MPQLYPGRRYTRPKAPLQILRGYYPTEPGHLSVTATPKTGEGIYQGMAITKDANGEWVKATTANKTSLTTSVFIARHDQDDPAVQASGKLVGLDCSGSFEVQTGYALAGSYALDVEVAVEGGGVTGNFKVAATGDKVVGKVSAIGMAANGLIAYGGKSFQGAIPVGTVDSAGLVTPTALRVDAARLQFKTVAHYIKA